jgi:hypothetical protein
VAAELVQHLRRMIGEAAKRAEEDTGMGGAVRLSEKRLFEFASKKDCYHFYSRSQCYENELGR